jgi:hypothetical protein
LEECPAGENAALMEDRMPEVEVGDVYALVNVTTGSAFINIVGVCCLDESDCHWGAGIERIEPRQYIWRKKSCIEGLNLGGVIFIRTEESNGGIIVCVDKRRILIGGGAEVSGTSGRTRRSRSHYIDVRCWSWGGGSSLLEMKLLSQNTNQLINLLGLDTRRSCRRRSSSTRGQRQGWVDGRTNVIKVTAIPSRGGMEFTTHNSNLIWIRNRATFETDDGVAD